jgi:hypothetical protein
MYSQSRIVAAMASAFGTAVMLLTVNVLLPFPMIVQSVSI